MKKRYAIGVDLNKCIGCHTCEIVCKLENKVPISVWRIWVKEGLKGKYPLVRKVFLPVMCNHCENPTCVTVCPVKASIKREDGIVIVDPHRCIGCRYCMAACPYGMRYVNPLIGIVQKCDFCLHRIENNNKPACVASCPAKALVFGDLNDKNSEIYRFVTENNISVLKEDTGNHPQAFYAGLDFTLADKKGMPE